MTERPRGAVSRTADTFAVGPSSLAWDGTSLTIRLDEIAVPIPGRIRGTVRVVPTAITAAGVHAERKWQSSVVADRALRAGPGRA